MARERGILGVFVTLDELLSALRKLREEECHVFTVYSPIHFSQIQEIMQNRKSPVRYFTLAGGLLGGAAVVSLGYYAHSAYRLVAGGKPVYPIVPFVVPWFEGTVLFAVIFTVFAWILSGRLPRWRIPAAYDPRFSEDRFGILVACPEMDRERIAKILRDGGAEEIRDVGD